MNDGTQGGPGWDRFKRDAAKAEAIRLRTLEFQQQALRDVSERPSKAEMRRADGYPEPKPSSSAKSRYRSKRK